MSEIADVYISHLFSLDGTNEDDMDFKLSRSSTSNGLVTRIQPAPWLAKIEGADTPGWTFWPFHLKEN